MIPCYLFDIDGTLADGEHRLHHIQKHPKDWDSYFAACEKDSPIMHMRAVVLALERHASIVFVSGRRESTREVTHRWLKQHGFYSGRTPFMLYMRPDHDHRDDDILKIELLDKIKADRFEPIMAFDDRTRVVKAWRAAGIPCAQVAEGDF